MARPPRGGFNLGSLLKSTLESTLAQAGAVRTVLERGAREGRSRWDEARADRRRHDALADLGAAVLELIRGGEIDLEELPEVRDIVATLDELDGASPADARSSRVALPRTRDRFDARGGRGGSRDDEDERAYGGGEYERYEGEHDAADDDAGRGFDPGDDHRHAQGLGALSAGRGASAARGGPARASSDRDRDGDGTVSSSRWSRPAPAAPAARVWRPPARPPHDAGDPHGPASAAPAIPAVPELPTAIAQAHRGGGISFDDDDLADYMHPDDVPAKPPAPSGSKPPHDEP